MGTLENLARAALARDGLGVRSLVQDLLAETPRLSDLSQPGLSDPQLLAVAAALVEVLAERLDQPPPAWTRSIGGLAEPFYLLAAAEHMHRLRHLCETQSPEPLRRRRLLAPPNYLSFA